MRQPIVVLVMVACAVLMASAEAATSRPTTVRVSVSSAEVQANGDSFGGRITEDGRFVAFMSEASNLARRPDTNGAEDVFVRDRLAGRTRRVSVSGAGVQGNGESGDPSISAGGRYVAFDSGASNLVHRDTNRAFDVFVRDRLTDTTRRVSRRGTQPDGASSGPVISGDGRFVAFVSSATNLVAGDTNRRLDVFEYDRVTRRTIRVSVSSSGEQATGRSGEFGLAISRGGRFVAFASAARNLVEPPTHGHFHVFVHDRIAGTTELVSMASDGTRGNGEHFDPAISADGRFVAFESDSKNLLAGGTNGTLQVYVHDRRTGRTELVSVSNRGAEGNASSQEPVMSPDARIVAFQTEASNFGAGGGAYVRDRLTGRTTRISSGFPEGLSRTGRLVTFESPASNVVPHDTNQSIDVFLRDRGPR